LVWRPIFQPPYEISLSQVRNFTLPHNLTQEAWTTDALIVDRTAPVAVTAIVVDGQDATTDDDYITLAQNRGNGSSMRGASSQTAQRAIDIWISWRGFHEAESWIDHFLVGLGTSNQAPDIVPYSKAPGSATHVFRTVSVAEGTRFFGFVKAVNVAGQTSEPIVSNGAVVDLVAPTIAQWALDARAAMLDLEAEAITRNISTFLPVLQPSAFVNSPGYDRLNEIPALLTVGASHRHP
jgi:hypothetical protein